MYDNPPPAPPLLPDGTPDELIDAYLAVHSALARLDTAITALREQPRLPHTVSEALFKRADALSTRLELIMVEAPDSPYADNDEEDAHVT